MSAGISKSVIGGGGGTAPSVVIKVAGVDKLVRNLNRIGKNIGKGVERGFLKSASLIERESLKIVPFQTGNLKGAWFIEKKGVGLKADVAFGYRGVEYAAWVHEIPGENLYSPVTHGKFFNIKHADEIAKAKGTWMGTAEGGMFKRKPEEQWKFLEQPLRDNVQNILQIVRSEITKIK
jgi:hypothetical protein